MPKVNVPTAPPAPPTDRHAADPPDGVGGVDRLARRRIGQAAWVAMGVFGAFAVVNGFVHDATRMAATSGSAALFALAALLTLRFSGRDAVAANLLVTGFAVQVFGEMAVNGGLAAASTPLAALVVPAAIMLAGLRAGLVWCVVVLGCLAVLAVLDHGNHLPPVELTAGALVLDRALSLTAGVVLAGLVVGEFSREATASLAALRAERSRYEHEATHDGLTGLPNRNLFMQSAAERLARARDLGGRYSLFYLDVDEFKRVNDRYGHEAGDRLLIAFGARLQSVLQPGDIAARLAGDEFVMLVAACGTDEVSARVALVRHTLSAEPFDLGGAEIRATASIGHAVFPDHAGDLAALLRAADHAMYRVKSSPRPRTPLPA